MTDALRDAAQQALRIFDWLERRAIYGDAEMAAVHAKLRAAMAAPPAAPPVPAGMVTRASDMQGVIEWADKAPPVGTVLYAAAAQPVPATGAQPAPAHTKAQRVHALVNAGPVPGMSEAFNAHMGAECWTDPAYAPDASMWAAAWKAATAQPAPAAVPAGWVCYKCGTDRTKAACPKGHHAALTGGCPMFGTAQAAAPQQAPTGGATPTQAGAGAQEGER